MTAKELLKGAVGVGILALVTYTMFRGQGWWWRLTVRGRVTFALLAVAVIVGVGFYVKLGP